MLRQGTFKRFKKATSMILDLVDDLAWIQNEFNGARNGRRTHLY